MGRWCAAGVAVLLLAAPVFGQQQCCGDCDGDGHVTIAELVRAVSNALDDCGVVPVATPSPTPDQLEMPCSARFTRANLGVTDPVCEFEGMPAGVCLHLRSRFYSDGTQIIVMIDTTPPLYLGARANSATTATPVGFWTAADFSDFTAMRIGQIALGNGTVLHGQEPGYLAIGQANRLPCVGSCSLCNLSHYVGGSVARSYPPSREQIRAMFTLLSHR